MPHKVITRNITKETEKNAYTENEEHQNYRKNPHYIVILNQLQLDQLSDLLQIKLASSM
jgi:Rps23 Pro-64 3,4-dihydroxylase Tpa1-like proline 4-hydroxylase